MHKGVDHKYKSAVTPELIAKRVFFFKRVAEIVEKSALPSGVEIRICGVRIVNAAYSYYYDKFRHTDFHGHNGGPSDPKKLAFMVRWIAKIKPFSVSFDDSVSVSDKYYYQNMINSIFCYVLSIVILGRDNGIGQKSAEQLMYTLHYGDFSHNMLIAFFEKKQ